MEKEIESLEAEVNLFASKLPYWGQFLCEKLLSGTPITDTEINTAYSHLLEDLDLKTKTTRADVTFLSTSSIASYYKKDLSFAKFENFEGVNALCEKQVIEFSPNLTILFGANGSGKSGYIRILKKAFYSKSPEDIQPNVYTPGTPKKITADFSFSSSVTEYSLNYPTNAGIAEFQQFAVFDGKSVLKHLENKNQFEFRPSGLSFFSALTDAINKIETKLNTDIAGKQSINIFNDLFDGTSEIKLLLSALTGNTKIALLEKYLPFTKNDIKEKQEKQKKHDEILLASRNKQKEIDTLNTLKQLIMQINLL